MMKKACSEQLHDFASSHVHIHVLRINHHTSKEYVGDAIVCLTSAL